MFKVGDKVKIVSDSYGEKYRGLIIEVVPEGKCNSSNEGVWIDKHTAEVNWVNETWNLKDFELAEEEVKSKFAVGDKVVSIKNTPQASEGFIGYVTLILSGQYGIHVIKEGEYGAKAFDEDELELLSRREEGVIHNTTINATVEEAEYTGGSSSYYKVDVTHPTTSAAPYQAECNDVIEALGLTFTEGNIFKAIWRIAADRNGKKKKGNNSVYDAEKVVFFAERLLVQEKSKEGK